MANESSHLKKLFDHKKTFIGSAKLDCQRGPQHSPKSASNYYPKGDP